MGEADLVKRVLDLAGFRLDFWRVRMRPGSPFSFGWLPRDEGEQPVFGLPGNPSSAFVTFEVFVRPFLRKRAGHYNIHRTRLRCRAGEDLPGTKRDLFMRVRLEEEDGEFRAWPTGPQGSGLVRGLADAQGLAMIPGGTVVPQGGVVDVLLLDPVPAPAPPGGDEGT